MVDDQVTQPGESPGQTIHLDEFSTAEWLDFFRRQKPAPGLADMRFAGTDSDLHRALSFALSASLLIARAGGAPYFDGHHDRPAAAGRSAPHR